MDALDRRAFVKQLSGATLCSAVAGALMLSFTKPGHARNLKKDCEKSGGKWVGSSKNDGHCIKHLPPDEVEWELLDVPDPPLRTEANQPRGVGDPKPAALSR